MATGSGYGKMERSATSQVSKDGNWFWVRKNDAKCDEAGFQGWELVLGAELDVIPQEPAKMKDGSAGT